MTSIYSDPRLMAAQVANWESKKKARRKQGEEQEGKRMTLAWLEKGKRCGLILILILILILRACDYWGR